MQDALSCSSELADEHDKSKKPSWVWIASVCHGPIYLPGNSKRWRRQGFHRDMRERDRKDMIPNTTTTTTSSPLPSPPSTSLHSAMGVALGGQRHTDRQTMITRVGGWLPGGQGLFKPINWDSYAKVIKQLLVCEILGLRQRRRESLSPVFLVFFLYFASRVN